MPQLRMRDAGGALRTITRIRMRDATNTLQTIQQIRMRDGTNALRTVFQYLTATVDITNEYQSGSGPLSNGFVTSDTITASAVGGTAPYTYAWEHVDGSLAMGNGDSPSTAATTFSATVSEFFTQDATFRCKITDANGAFAYTPEVFVSLEWFHT